jgi:hypothetical protein
MCTMRQVAKLILILVRAAILSRLVASLVLDICLRTLVWRNAMAGTHP